MRKLQIAAFITIAIFVLASALPSPAQAGKGAYGMRNYDPGTEVTVKGSVEEVTQQAGQRGWSGTHLTLKGDNETFDVHVGPSWFVSQNQFSFAKGDQIEVTGSKVKLGAGNAILAREIKKGDKTLVLRNAQGIPQWSGRRGR